MEHVMTAIDQQLISAAHSGNLEQVRKALDEGADIHARDDRALVLATDNGHADTITLLLDRGADIHADGDGALVLAAEHTHAETVTLLLDRGADIHAALRTAEKDGYSDAVALLTRLAERKDAAQLQGSEASSRVSEAKSQSHAERAISKMPDQNRGEPRGR